MIKYTFQSCSKRNKQSQKPDREFVKRVELTINNFFPMKIMK